MSRRKDVLSWDDYFMSLAFLSSQRSKDPATQVGAVIVNTSRQIIGTGYNGFPHGCSDDDLPWEKVGDWADTKYPYGKLIEPSYPILLYFSVCHAEMNAILNKNTADCTGATIYTTLFPCNECSKLIIQSRIKRVVYAHRKTNGNPVFTTSERLLEMAKIETVEFESKNQVNTEPSVMNTNFKY